LKFVVVFEDQEGTCLDLQAASSATVIASCEQESAEKIRMGEEHLDEDWEHEGVELSCHHVLHSHWVVVAVVQEGD
jgi:hypothetical protein